MEIARTIHQFAIRNSHYTRREASLRINVCLSLK